MSVVSIMVDSISVQDKWQKGRVGETQKQKSFLRHLAETLGRYLPFFAR